MPAVNSRSLVFIVTSLKASDPHKPGRIFSDKRQLCILLTGKPCAEFRRVFDDRAGMRMRGGPAADGINLSLIFGMLSQQESAISNF